ncbi:MAG: T9SS type A sorting domain-containing protein [Ignavibacteriae bacterium]|nr:T9SS type A sorting domain-containing protein [Ignavibacteriota bacterium]
MKMLRTTFLLLLAVSGALAQLPPTGLRHHFLFNNAANLELATIGNNLVRGNLTGATPTFTAVAGPVAGNGAVEIGTGSFYRLNMDFDPNGPVGATRVNRFTLVIDYYLPVPNVWYTFHASDNDGNPMHSDWDSFINTQGKVGLFRTGYSQYSTPALEWHRLVIAADLGTSYKYYLDGQLAQNGGPDSVDRRLSLPSLNGANQLMLFGDNDGDDAPIRIAELGVYDRALTAEEIWTMGGYGHAISYGPPVGNWMFDDASNLLLATAGRNLTLVGTHTAVPGPSPANGAARIPVGSHYIAHHDMVKNGGGNLVNEYSLVVDFKIPALGSWYTFLQTDTANASDGELFINPSGKIGVGLTGYSDSAVVAGEWYRLVLACNLGDSVGIYLDGKQIRVGGAQVVDGRLAIQPRVGANKVILFGDNDGDDGVIDIANVTFYNRVLTKTEITNLGGFAHIPPTTEVTGAKKAVYFDGTDTDNKYARITKSNSDFDFGNGNFTIETWVKPDFNFASDPALVSDKNWASGSNPGWVISVRPFANDWRFNMADTGRVSCNAYGPKINDGNWHYLAVIAREDSGVKLITDDSVSAWQTSGGSFFQVGNINTSMPVCIAQDGTEHYSDGPPTPAIVDELRIWKGVAIDPQALLAWQSRDINATHPNWSTLVGYWKFNEVSGDTLYDGSPRGHHAKLFGSPRRLVSFAALGDSIVQTLTGIATIWGGDSASTSGAVTATGDFPYPTMFAPLAPLPGQVDHLLTSLDNPFAVFAHNNLANATTNGVPAGVQARVRRVWYFDVTETAVSGASMTFDLSDLGGSGNAGDTTNYVLLKAATIAGPFAVTSARVTVSGDRITFSGFSLSQGYYTVGSRNLTTSPLGGLIIVSVKDVASLPMVYQLADNYPNPFNPVTTVKYQLPVDNFVTLKVYDIVGREVATLVNGFEKAGYKTVAINASNLASGVYFYRLIANGVDGSRFEKSKKMIVLK